MSLLFRCPVSSIAFIDKNKYPFKKMNYIHYNTVDPIYALSATEENKLVFNCKIVSFD